MTNEHDTHDSYLHYVDTEVGNLFDVSFKEQSEIFGGKSVVADTISVLSRLPATPMELYSSQETRVHSSQVVSRLNTATLKVALACTTVNYAATDDLIRHSGFIVRLFLDYMSEFIDMLEQLKAQWQTGPQRDQLNLFQSFL
jgi:hypothetical protein